MSNLKGRPRTDYDIIEVDEIIEKKAKSVDFDLSKVTYNSVCNFNEYLVIKKLKNYKGDSFRKYGYAFWAGTYKGKINIGHERIDFFKKQRVPVIAGEGLEMSVDDIVTILDNNKNNFSELKRHILKQFKKERLSNAHNDEMFDKLQIELKHYKELANSYQKALFTLFYNSRYSTNSWNDKITLSKEGDFFIQNEINKLFNNEFELMDFVETNQDEMQYNKLNSNILNIADILSRNKSD